MEFKIKEDREMSGHGMSEIVYEVYGNGEYIGTFDKKYYANLFVCALKTHHEARKIVFDELWRMSHE